MSNAYTDPTEDKERIVPNWLPCTAINNNNMK